MTSESDSLDPLFADLLANGCAYADLVRGANRLLAGNLAWTERILLRLVNTFAKNSVN